MSYSKSRKAVVRIKELLEHLLEADGTIEFETDDPDRLAYVLREAFHAAANYEDLSRYAQLKKMYVLSIRNGVLRATRKQKRIASIPEIKRVKVLTREVLIKKESAAPTKKMRERIESAPAPSKSTKAAVEIAEALETVELPDQRDVSEVLGMALVYGKKNKEMYFPDATNLSSDDLARINRWCVNGGWKLIWQEDRGITITKKEVPNEIVWKAPES